MDIKAAHDEVWESQGGSEVELMTNSLLEERVEQLEEVLAPRNQIINDIEVKFTDYLRLRGYHENVNSEFSTLNGMLSQSATEVREYQAELMVAAQDDEGSTMRIEELERRKNQKVGKCRRTWNFQS